jgi:hypothetical protein
MVGTINIQASGPKISAVHFSTLPSKKGYGISGDLAWITYNGVNLLWLPAEYRPTYPSLFAVSGKSLAIGCSPYRVIFLVFSEESFTPDL